MRIDDYTTETQDATAFEALHNEPSPPPVRSDAHQVAAPGNNPQQLAAHGLSQTFGLLPGVAVLTVASDVMLHGADVVSAGLLIPLSVLGGAVLGYITWKSQTKFYGDDDESAKIKALIVAFLTAIPSPLPYMLFIPAGLLGLVHSLRRKS